MLMHIILMITTIIATQIVVDDDMFFIRFRLSVLFINFLVVIIIGSMIINIEIIVILFVAFWM